MTKTKTPRVKIARESLLRSALAFWLHEGGAKRGTTWKQVGQWMGISASSAASCGKRFEQILMSYAAGICVDAIEAKRITTNRKETNG